MENGEILFMPHSRSLASMAHGLYEIRVRDLQGIIRVFYFTKIKNSIFLRKKSRTISDQDRMLILKRIHEISVLHKG